MMKFDAKLKLTALPCWKCGGALYQVDPPLRGWEYYCDACGMLTATRSQLDQAMAKKDPEALGIVAGIPCKMTIKEAK